MKKLLRFLLFIILGMIFMILAVICIPDQYDEIYQRSIVKQYDYLKSVDGEKIVLVGNSSLMFGIDLDEMNRLSKKTSVLLGGHVSYGIPYFLEMTREYLKEGDIVVIELPGQATMNDYNPDLLLTGIGDRYDMYRYFPKQWRKVIALRYLKYVKDNFNYWIGGGYHSGGAYSMEAMDYRGSMKYERLDCEIPFPYEKAVGMEDQYQWYTFSDFTPNEDYISYMNEYTDYCSELGVTVLFTIPCYLDEAVKSTEEEMDAYDKAFLEALKGKYISRQKDYIFTRDYIYNQAAHCNTKGAVYRTQLLYKDIIMAIGN